MSPCVYVCMSVCAFEQSHSRAGRVASFEFQLQLCFLPVSVNHFSGSEAQVIHKSHTAIIRGGCNSRGQKQIGRQRGTGCQGNAFALQ